MNDRLNELEKDIADSDGDFFEGEAGVEVFAWHWWARDQHETWPVWTKEEPRPDRNAIALIRLTDHQAIVARLTKERDEAVEYAATSTSAKLESANGALTQQLTEKDTEIKRLRESLSNAAYWLDHAGYGMAADNARAALNGGAK